MGYTLQIGNARIDTDPNDPGVYITIDIMCGKSLGAPLNSGEDHGNTVCPSYVGWEQFTRDTGLYLVFYGPEGLLAPSHSTQKLTPEILQGFERARILWRELPATDQRKRKATGSEGVDWNLRRLDWLCWWTDWALKNCQVPAFSS